MNKKKKLKNYLIDENSDIYAVSLVDEPAIESNFIYLKKQKPIFLESDEKRMIYGCALRPDFPIYRIYDDEEFYVTFSRETVEKLSQKFLKNGFQKNWTVDHQDAITGVYAVESWIKTDMEKDKSIALGLDKDLPIGSWFVGCKVDNDDVWQRVKNGDFQGFSIEAFVELDEFNKVKNSDKYMIQNVLDEDSFLDKIKNIINDALGKPIEESVVEPTQEPVIEEAIEQVVEDVVEEKVEEEIADVAPIVEEQVIDEPIVEEPAKEDVVEEVVEDVVEKIEENATSEDDVKREMQEVIDGLNEEIRLLNEQLEQLRNENKKLGGQPTAQPINVHSEKKTPWETVQALRDGSYFRNK